MSDSKAKTDLTKQELMRIFEEQIELKNAEIERLKEKDVEYAKLVFAQAKEYAEKMAEKDERLDAIRKHYEKMPKENQSIYWTSICDDDIQDEFIGQKFFPDLQKWYQVLGVLLKQPITKPMWKCPCCKPTLWFGDLEKLKEHVRQKHPEAQPKGEATKNV